MSHHQKRKKEKKKRKIFSSLLPLSCHVFYCLKADDGYYPEIQYN